RILDFMTEVEKELWKLGIPAKTRHNEVAPAQFELAPVFEDVNLACDHNMLTMETLRQVADRRGLVCLLHEKPFAGVNGSGKHNNWSINYGDLNLLEPGHDPHQNAIFLTVLCGIIEAIDKHANLLRSSVAGAGNDHRLGANEAPPAVISMYLGDQLADVIEQLEKGQPKSSKRSGAMRIGVDALPPLPRDATDRNRTSPFAFTGNKFEFRAPGSSQSCSGPNIILNTIVAEAFDRISDELEKLSKADFNNGLQATLQKIIKTHKRIIFNGDGYTEEWLKEAERRGLPNAKTTMESLKALIAPKSIALFEKYKVFTARELESRYEVFEEDFHSRIHIEGEIALELATSMIEPEVSKEFGNLAKNIAAAKEAGLTKGLPALTARAKILGAELDKLHKKCAALKVALKGVHEEIIEAMEDLRTTVDALEQMIPDECWPLPKYREMLFVY
ncbi:MAG: glutamine synthetase type III, partial [Alphaproteobacteria bacterium]|nr:glutamine synthetase type III [Alphaproteobacteria bacterium]